MIMSCVAETQRRLDLFTLYDCPALAIFNVFFLPIIAVIFSRSYSLTTFTRNLFRLAAL